MISTIFIHGTFIHWYLLYKKSSLYHALLFEDSVTARSSTKFPFHIRLRQILPVYISAIEQSFVCSYRPQRGNLRWLLKHCDGQVVTTLEWGVESTWYQSQVSKDIETRRGLCSWRMVQLVSGHLVSLVENRTRCVKDLSTL